MADTTGICAFCQQAAQLQDSHILPAFIYRALRSRSGTGHIRMTDNVNRRVQDGLKQPWLCRPCEGLFSRYETAFATKVFHPWLAGQPQVAYQDWLLKFCTSVSWRVLRFARGRNKAATYTAEQMLLLDESLERWRLFLVGEVPHPGPFEQHLVIMDDIKSTSIPDLPININRFMNGAVTLDIVGTPRALMTFAKLGRFMIFGMIQRGPDPWMGTKVHVRHGVLRQDAKVTIPAGLLGLFKDKARLASDAMEGLSAAQRAKIDQAVLRDPDAFIASKQFVSIMADGRMFGEEAVFPNPKEGI